MSFPSSGVYKIKNVETGTYLNLQGAGTTTRYCGQSLDSDTGIVTFQTAVADTFIQTKDGAVSAGTPLVTGSTVVEFQLVSNGNDEYRIHLTDEGTDMVFYLPSSTDYTPVVLQVNNDESTNQLWTFLED